MVVKKTFKMDEGSISGGFGEIRREGWQGRFARGEREEGGACEQAERDVHRAATPEGFPNKAKGCAYPRYPGKARKKNIQPRRGCPFYTRDAVE